jgi:murein DD-endopeptidase MepM/ murein hydrolase activator NlpD
VSRRSHDTPRLWSLPLTLPRSGRVTSPYGGAREYNGRVTSRHTGTDFAGAVGAPVVAPTRGVVAMVVDFYLAGKAVYLDHGAGLVTGYFHLSRADVAPGDTVRAGQRIGAVGRSGRVTGPHLHWIMRYGTISIDPMSMVELGRIEPEEREK